MLLSKFGNEVLSKGPEAVLPQNLSLQWLSRMQKIADDFLDTNFSGEECSTGGFRVEPILSACVSEITRFLNKGNVEMTEQEVRAKTTLYVLAVTLESVRREVALPVEPATLENIFEVERYAELKGIRPELGEIYQRLCLNFI